MPLDPQARAYLDEQAALNAPPISQISPAEAREGFIASIDRSGSPEEVASVENRTIPGPAGAIPIRIYRPRGAGAGPLPVLVFFHGGGWVIGNLDTVDVPVRALANRSGCLVVSVDYRLAPEAKFPAAADDCYVATRWVADNAGALGADANRLAVSGDSAGGNLTAVVTLRARDLGGPAIAFQIPIYPVTDRDFTTASYIENADDYGLTRDAMIWFWDHYIPSTEDGRHPYAAPLRAADLSGLPPAFIITAEYDVLRDEGEAYAARLREAGVEVDLKRYDGMIHGFFSMGGVLDRGNDVIDEIARALRAALG
jgi:acetyl esterase